MTNIDSRKWLYAAQHIKKKWNTNLVYEIFLSWRNRQG